MRLSAEQTQKLIRDGRIDPDDIKPKASLEQPRRSKYGNKKVERYGMVFDSKLEADTYDDLAFQYGADRIMRQVSLRVAQKTTRRLVLDFGIIRDVVDGLPSIELVDAKGFESPAWRAKAKVFVETWNIPIIIAERGKGRAIEYRTFK